MTPLAICRFSFIINAILTVLGLLDNPTGGSMTPSESANGFGLASCSATLWSTNNTVDSLQAANFSFEGAFVPHRQGVRDVIRTVKSLDIPRFHYSQIQRGRSVGEGETFWVEQCQIDGKAVAVKHLKVGRYESGRPEFLRRVESLLLELRIMHHNPLKSHPNILTLIGYGWNTDGGGILPYILVDYCANGNARQYLRARHVPPIRKELMIADVAAGIHALHTTGIVHGDVKLENVLVFDGVHDTRRSYPLAKLCDFGHSIVIGLGSESQKPAFFGGTSRYNAPEVYHQKSKPIPRIFLKRCDVWAFGLLAWEVLLDGLSYTTQTDGVAEGCPCDGEGEVDHSGYSKILESAMWSIRIGTDDIQRAIFRELFKKTIVVDPDARTTELDALLIMSKWKNVLFPQYILHLLIITSNSGSVRLSAQLALHTGDSEWSYEIFRYEYDREISWLHKEHITRDLQRILGTETESLAIRGSAAWQLAMCYTTGFGVSTAEHEADNYFAKASELGSDIAQALSPLVLQSGYDHNGNTYTDLVLTMLASRSAVEAVRLASQNMSSNSSRDMRDGNDSIHAITAGINTVFIDSTETAAQRQTMAAATTIKLERAIRRKSCAEILALHRETPLHTIVCQEPLLILGLKTRDHKVVETLIGCGLSPEKKDGSGRTAFHWLFMLDDTSIYAVGQSLASYRQSTALNLSAEKVITVHIQWPLQLRGTPLSHAIAVGSRATVKALIDLGADLLAPDHAPESFKTSLDICWTPIHAAVSYHRPDILRDLLSAADESHTTITRFPRLLAHALCNSTVFEQMAMHGQNHGKNLKETIGLLGRSEILQEQSHEGLTAIMHAMNRMDFRLISALLQQNRSIASQRLVSPTSVELSIFHYPIHQAAHLASRSDDPAVLKLLQLIIEHDHDALIRCDHDGRTCLHIAASGTSSRASLFLLQQAPSLLTATDKHGAFPLHYCESPSVAEQLCALGASTDVTDIHGKTALHNAVTKGLGPLVKKLCEMRKEANMPLFTNYSPLHVAVQNMRHEITVVLLGYGASPNDRNNMGNTALHIAAMGSPRHILKALIGADADVSILNNRGESPLFIAVDHRNAAAIEELSCHQPKLIMTPRRKLDKDEPSISPLLLCAQKHEKAGIDCMLPLIPRADLEAIDSKGRNILHLAAMLGSPELVAGLIQLEIGLDVQDYRGETALILAIRHSYLLADRQNCAQICGNLISHGASTTTENDAGEMAWDVAINDIRDETYEVLSLLLTHSDESCRKVTKEGRDVIQSEQGTIVVAKHTREPCEKDLVYQAVHRPHQKLRAALKTRLPEAVFTEAENLALQDIDPNISSISRETMGDKEWQSRMQRKHRPVPEISGCKLQIQGPSKRSRIKRFIERNTN